MCVYIDETNQEGSIRPGISLRAGPIFFKKIRLNPSKDSGCHTLAIRLRDWSLITGRGGLQNGRGGASEVLPLRDWSIITGRGGGYKMGKPQV